MVENSIGVEMISAIGRMKGATSLESCETLDSRLGIAQLSAEERKGVEEK